MGVACAIIATLMLLVPHCMLKMRTRMGKISLFTLDGCPVCKKAMDLFSAKNVDVETVSLTEYVEWKQLLFLLTGGISNTKPPMATHCVSPFSCAESCSAISLSIGIQTVPQVFLNDKCIGGFKQLEELDKQGKLDAMIKECLASVDSPLLLRTPLVTEFIEVYKIHNNYCSDLRCSKYIHVRVLCPSNYMQTP